MVTPIKTTTPKIIIANPILESEQHLSVSIFVSTASMKISSLYLQVGIVTKEQLFYGWHLKSEPTNLRNP